MHIYLPIAEVSVNAFLLLGLGGIVGVLSGMFGVGGGFLMTPLLFFIGIPPAVAVATEANQIVASSFSGVLAHLKRKTVDFRMGGVLLVGGLIGAALGVQVFNYLKSLGQVDLLVTLCYVVFLGVIGALMFIESLRAIRRSKRSRSTPRAQETHMGPRPALQDEVPHVGPVSLGDPAGDRWHSCGRAGGDHGGRWWLHHGPGDDLHPWDANESGGRDFAVPDHLRYRLHHDAARDDKLHSRHDAGGPVADRRRRGRADRYTDRREAEGRATAHRTGDHGVGGLRKAGAGPVTDAV